MTRLDALEGLWRLLTKPFRVAAAVFRFLVDMTPRQIESLCTCAILGALVVWNLQDLFLLALARSASRSTEERFFELVADLIEDHSWLTIMGVVAVVLIAWGARHFDVKVRDIELRMARGDHLVDANGE
ncbi:hypothetical protein [Novosphingobium aquimarinum]|uniref:hypothetical protein n=1 Tax=Novosphingobium aquimarinum TaxID=2682494 RepID=UPI0012EB7490|nr:hypothetical protein [Novosphingobium aquimarinum]